MPTTEETSVARLHAVAHAYGSGARALQRTSAEIAPGTLLAILGPNGSGKTTLLRLLAGSLVPHEGSVERLGDATSPPPPRVRRRIGYVPQDLALDPEMTGRETLRLFATLEHVSPRDAAPRIRDLLERMGIRDKASDRVARWSGGQKRRLHLAVGLLHDPELLLLDEPTAGLDPEARERVWQALALRARASGATVVVTHDLEHCGRHADRLLFLHEGRIVGDGTPAEIVERHAAPSLVVYAPEDARESAATALAGHAAVAGVRREGAAIVASLRGEAEAEAIVADLRRRSIPVDGHRRHPADLRSAYRTLCGAAPPPARDRRRRSS